MKLKYVSLGAVISTLLLLALGNIVTATGSGMGCGDHWPGCNGQLIPDFTNPAVIIEFTHRAFALLVSLLVLVVTVMAWRVKTVRLFALAAFMLLVCQVLLGAVTVKLILPPYIIILHLAVSMAFLSALTVVMLQAFQMESNQQSKPNTNLHRFACLTAIATYLQIVLGAYVRHSGAALACPDIPTCQGSWVPELGLPLVHFSHRLGAILVAMLVMLLAHKAKGSSVAFYTRLAALFVIVQITLGILVVLSGLSVYWTSGHIVIGAGLLMTLIMLAFKTKPSMSPVRVMQKSEAALL